MKFLKAAAAVGFLLLATTSAGYAQLLTNPRAKNGVRLQGGSGPRGRVELSSVDAWFTNFSATPVKPAWNRVCDKGFDDATALIMCKLLGYSYGRKAYGSRFTYLKDASLGHPIGNISCEPTRTLRRLRGVVAAGEADLGVATAADVDGDATGRRSLYTPLSGTLNAPARAPYRCSFYSGACDPKGPLAGLECSNTPMPAARPPPPAPPAPPPAPPAPSTTIRLIGGRPIDRVSEEAESNLICLNNGTRVDRGICYGYGRIEVQVKAPGGSGSLTWAPVCDLNDKESRFFLRFLACQQALDWPDGTGVTSVSNRDLLSFGLPPAAANSTSAAPQPPSVFNPASYSGWVSINEPISPTADPRRVQDLSHTVSAAPCSALLIVQCQVWGLTGGR